MYCCVSIQIIAHIFGNSNSATPLPPGQLRPTNLEAVFKITHPDKLTAAQLEQIERIVNEQIQADLPLTMATLTLAEALKGGRTGLFWRTVW